VDKRLAGGRGEATFFGEDAHQFSPGHTWLDLLYREKSVGNPLGLLPVDFFTLLGSTRRLLCNRRLVAERRPLKRSRDDTSRGAIAA
jgi:hypothetical protein